MQQIRRVNRNRACRWPILALAALMAGVPTAAQSACHWIRLTGLTVERTSDFLAWGDYLPLIGLEAGQLYSLLPGSEGALEIRAKREQPIDGHWYYVPRHLIDGEAMDLTLMVLDRDEETDDDLVLPLRIHRVDLSAGFSPQGRKSFEIDELYVLDDNMTKSNAVRFRFELKRTEGACGDEGMDRAHRRASRVHELRSRIFRYFDEPVLGGREAKLFVEYQTDDAATAYAIARRNLHELMALGREVERLEGAEGFDELRHDLGKLIAQLEQKRLTFTREGEVDGKTNKVVVSAPALASDPEWKRFIPEAEIDLIPERWRLR